MIACESRSSRRIVGRLDRGEDLFDALLEVCRKHSVLAGEIRGLGSFETVELAEYDQAQKVWKPARKFSGGFELLNLTGNVSERDGKSALHAHVTLMRDRDSGVEMLGGHLNRARVFAFEFVIDAWDDWNLLRAPDPQTGLVLWNKAIPRSAMSQELQDANEKPTNGETIAPTPVQPKQAAVAAEKPADAVSWSDVANASDSSDPHPEAQQPELSPGDLIDHPKFGRCQVERVEGNGEFANLRLRNARLVRISLDVIRLVPAGKEGDKALFRAILGT